MNETNSQNQDNRSRSGSSLLIPIAIIIGFALIAAAIFFSGSKTPITNTMGASGSSQADLSKLNPITADDHIRGNPNAPLMIVEYSDFDCVFCHSFHSTLQKIIDNYGATGQVAWVYRHFPITSLHPSAGYLAEASECVAELGGNDAFWKFADMVFLERSVDPATGQLPPTDLSRVPEFASLSGVNKDDFQSCLDSGRNKSKVEEDFNNAVAIGGNGTPHSVIVVGDQTYEISGGAQPYEMVKQMVDSLLK